MQPTADGCVLTLELDDARWYSAMQRVRLSRTFRSEVVLDPAAGTFVAEDTEQAVEWRAGAEGSRPVVGASLVKTAGRVTSISFQKSISADGVEGGRGDFTFDTRGARRMLAQVAEEQGWTERLSGKARIGLRVLLAVIGLIVALGILALILVFAI